MKKEVLKNWLRFATVIVCVMFALVLLMAEPNKPYTGLTWMVMLIAEKVGALACGLIAYVQLEKLTEEIKK